MKLIKYIALVQTFLLVVDYCSADTYESPFQGKWCEYCSTRDQVQEFMTKLEFPRETTATYVNANPVNLTIHYNQTNQMHVIYGQDPTGVDFQLNFPWKANRFFTRADFFGKHAYFKSAHYENELFMNFYPDQLGVTLYFKFEFTVDEKDT